MVSCSLLLLLVVVLVVEGKESHACDDGSCECTDADGIFTVHCSCSSGLQLLTLSGRKLPKNTYNLTISNCESVNMEDSLNRLQILRSLTIADVGQLRLGPGNFLQGQSNIISLIIRNTSLEHIPPQAFSKLSNVHLILFQDVKIGTIHSEAFSTLHKVNYFYFDTCWIGTIKSQAFGLGDSSLTYLKFQSVFIERLEPYAINLKAVDDITIDRATFFNPLPQNSIVIQSAIFFTIINTTFHSTIRSGSLVTKFRQLSITGTEFEGVLMSGALDGLSPNTDMMNALLHHPMLGYKLGIPLKPTLVFSKNLIHKPQVYSLVNNLSPNMDITVEDNYLVNCDCILIRWLSKDSRSNRLPNRASSINQSSNFYTYFLNTTACYQKPQLPLKQVLQECGQKTRTTSTTTTTTTATTTTTTTTTPTTKAPAREPLKGSAAYLHKRPETYFLDSERAPSTGYYTQVDNSTGDIVEVTIDNATIIMKKTDPIIFNKHLRTRVNVLNSPNTLENNGPKKPVQHTATITKQVIVKDRIPSTTSEVRPTFHQPQTSLNCPSACMCINSGGSFQVMCNCSLSEDRVFTLINTLLPYRTANLSISDCDMVVIEEPLESFPVLRNFILTSVQRVVIRPFSLLYGASRMMQARFINVSIPIIPEGAFANMTSIDTVAFYGVDVLKIASGAFANTVDVNFLLFEHCSIKEIERNAFGNFDTQISRIKLEDVETKLQNGAMKLKEAVEVVIYKMKLLSGLPTGAIQLDKVKNFHLLSSDLARIELRGLIIRYDGDLAIEANIFKGLLLGGAFSGLLPNADMKTKLKFNNNVLLRAEGGALDIPLLRSTEVDAVNNTLGFCHCPWFLGMAQRILEFTRREDPKYLTGSIKFWVDFLNTGQCASREAIYLRPERISSPHYECEDSKQIFG